MRAAQLPALLLLVACACAPTACSKSSTAPSDGGSADGKSPGTTSGAVSGGAADDDELFRWARREGIEAVVEAAKVGERKRPDAYRALAQSGEVRALAFLADEAKSREKDARAALEAANELAATPRKQVDPDDAEELRAACDTLLWLAREKGRPPKERALAVSTLRMMVAYGCVKATDIPVDLDAK